MTQLDQRVGVGAIVHYFEGVKPGNNIKPLAAIIVGVNDDNTVNLRVFASCGQFEFPKRHVKHMQRRHDSLISPKVINERWCFIGD